jgi:hypothetical protein
LVFFEYSYQGDPSKGRDTIANGGKVVAEWAGSVILADRGHLGQLVLGGLEQLAENLRSDWRLLGQSCDQDHLALGSEQTADSLGLKQ